MNIRPMTLTVGQNTQKQEKKQRQGSGFVVSEMKIALMTMLSRVPLQMSGTSNYAHRAKNIKLTQISAVAFPRLQR
jgi:hypothetical protein